MFRAWGYEGFNAHITNVAGFYRARKETFERHMREYLEGLAEWTSPDTGMFFWYVSCIQFLKNRHVDYLLFLLASSSRRAERRANRAKLDVRVNDLGIRVLGFNVSWDT